MDKYLVALGRFYKLGPQRFNALFSYFKNSEEVFCSNKANFIKAGLDERIAGELEEHIKKTDPDKEVELLEKYGINIVTINDGNYPERLKEIFSPPYLLYVRGELFKDEDCIAVVGSRRPTDYGTNVTDQIVSDIASTGVTIVSGLALGTDGIAHKAALKSQTRTIAVLGCGLDKIYPITNIPIAKKILETGGAIISEYPIGISPLKHHFPARNRIVSGLSRGILITEASKGSGSSITAKFALEQNRDVFAIPGSIYNKNSFGPNSLIKLGAKLVTEASDILDELGLKNIEDKKIAKKIYPADEEEAKILKLLESEPKHIDEITKSLKKDAHEVSSSLTMMEIKGIVKNMGGMVYTVYK